MLLGVMNAMAVFPVQQIAERQDGLYDLLGAVWDYQECEAFPWEGTVRLAVMLRRSVDDPVARHTLNVYAGVPSEGDEPMYSQPVPGLASGTRNGIAGIAVPVLIPAPGPFTVSVQIDDGPIVTTEFEMRQATA